MDFQKALAAIAAYLEEHDRRYALVGALALAAYGHPRATLDLDLVVELESQDEIRHYFEQHGLRERFDDLERSL
jgi:hypothetical protein